jgi:hypothetical protein
VVLTLMKQRSISKASSLESNICTPNDYSPSSPNIRDEERYTATRRDKGLETRKSALASLK